MFTVTLPLKTSPRDRSILRKRLIAANRVYNALIGEAISKLRQTRQSREWKIAQGFLAIKAEKPAKKWFGDARKNAEFGIEKGKKTTDGGLYWLMRQQQQATVCEGQNNKKHLDMHTIQALGRKAFAVVERSLYKKGGKPHFRRISELRSVEGTGPGSPLRWKNNNIEWTGLKIPAIIDNEDAVINHALNHEVRLARIVPKVFKGRDQYFAQLVCEGEPYRKLNHVLGKGIVGIDIGPSTIAIVASSNDGKCKHVEFSKLSKEISTDWKRIAYLARRLDRQTRQNNPDCFDERGRWLRGKRIYNRTQGMRETRMLLADMLRREREHRNNVHRQLAVKIFSLGDVVKIEKIAYTSWQRGRYGKSLRQRAPGLFVSTLKAVATKLGGAVEDISTWKTRLSQTCVCGSIRKKDLSERQHCCECGVKCHRDIFSAFLAIFVAGDQLDLNRAAKFYLGNCNSLSDGVERKANSDICGFAAIPVESRIERRVAEECAL